MVNTATIQRIHSTQSTTKLRLRRLKTKDTCTFCFRNTPTGKMEQTFALFAQPPRRNQPCHQLCSTITKSIHVLILLLTEIPQQGKQGKRLPRSPATQETPDFISLQLGWTITKLYTYQVLSGSPSTSPTASHHIPMLYTSPALSKY